MLKDVGINAEPKPADYGTVHNIKSSAVELPGMVVHNSTAFSDPTLLLDYLFAPGTSRNMMKVNDPIFNDLYAKQIAELDQKRRRELLIELCRHLAREMRFAPSSYASIANYTVGYNWYHNFWAYRNSFSGQGNAGEGGVHRWMNKT